MRWLFVLLLTGCKIMYPVTTQEVAGMCLTGTHTLTHDGVTKTFTVTLMDDVTEVCKKRRSAGCTVGQHIYLEQCQYLAHEVNHVFGNDWVDGFIRL